LDSAGAELAGEAEVSDEPGDSLEPELPLHADRVVTISAEVKQTVPNFFIGCHPLMSCVSC